MDEEVKTRAAVPPRPNKKGFLPHEITTKKAGAANNMKSEKTVKTSLLITEEQHRDMRLARVEFNRPVNDILVEAFYQWLNKQRKK